LSTIGWERKEVKGVMRNEDKNGNEGSRPEGVVSIASYL